VLWISSEKVCEFTTIPVFLAKVLTRYHKVGYK
jgi:hypothetical protein